MTTPTPIHSADTIRIVFDDIGICYEWIYDIPTKRVPSLDNYKNLVRSQHPSIEYTLGAHFAKNFKEYLVWESDHYDENFSMKL